MLVFDLAVLLVPLGRS